MEKDVFRMKIAKYHRVVFLTVAFCLIAPTSGLDVGAILNAQTAGVNNRIRMASDFERRGNYERALRIYLDLYRMVPSNQLYYEGVKRNMLRLRKYDELMGLIKDQLTRSNDVKLWADLGDVYYKAGRANEARELWSDLLKRYARDRRVYPYVAHAMLENRLYDEAIEVYKTARHNLKQEDLFIFELANIYVMRLNFKEATLEYLNYLEKYPKQFTYIAGRIAKYTSDPDRAREVAEVLKGFISKSRHEYLVRKILAGLYLQMGDFASALEEFKILEMMKNPIEGEEKIPGREIYSFAEHALNARKYEFARQGYQLLLEKYKQSPYRIRAEFGLALAAQKQGLTEEALASYDEIIKSVPVSAWAQEALFQKGEIYLNTLFDLDKAIATYRELLKKYPRGAKATETYFRLGDCFAARGDFQQAQTWYEKPLQLVRSNPRVRQKALYKSAYMDFIQGAFDRAQEKLHEITKDVGDKVTSPESYENDALELLFLIEENSNHSPEALKLFAHAKGDVLQRNYAEAVAKLSKILESYPTTGIVDESLVDLAEIENTRGNYPAAIAYFEGLLDQYPESVYNDLAQKRIGEIYENGLGDLQKAREAYEQILTHYPNSLYIEEVRQKLRSLESRRLSN